MFFANTFIFDGKPSEMYNLYIGEIGGSGQATTTGSNDVSLLTKKIFRKPVPLFYGVEQTPVLQFPLSAYCPGDMTAPDYSDVSAWLWGQQEYKKLRICQTDMMDLYYNCFLTAPQIVRVGNFIKAFTTTVLCDSPFAWREPKTYTYTYSDENVISTIPFFNESADVYYTFPTSLVITANIYGGSLTITNQSDNNRMFYITLSPNEVVTLNCDLQIISSTINSYPLSAFNKYWLRFIRGLNNLVVTGNITSMVITSSRAVKVGG